MKTRQGFVSNSSSSSYVIVLEKSVYDQLVETLTPLQKDILMYLLDRETPTRQFMRNTVKVIKYTDGNYATLDDYEEGMGESGFTSIRTKKIEKAKQKALENDEDATWGDMEYEDSDIDAPEEWEKVIEKIDKLPKDKVLRFEQEM